MFKYVDELPGFKRPQEPVKPYPYNEQEVEYENKGAGVKLAGTLTFPDSGGPFPAVILLTGSGQQNRNEEVFGHKPFLVLADYLTRQGIAVLRADDRGVGGSTGDFSQSTTGDFADDALAGVEYLKSRKEISPKHIGLVGHSEGGTMAPIAAAKSSAVAFIVMWAGPGQGFDDIIIFQHIEAGMSEEDIALQRSWYKSIYGVSKQDLDYDAAAKEIRRLFAELSEEEKKRLDWTEERLESEIPDLLKPWWRYAMAYDPRATLMRVKCPVLAIIGEKDTQVPSKANLPLIEEALEASGNMNFQVKELPGLNHLFQTAETGDVSEYRRIEETMSPSALVLISGWIKEQTRID
ncbi:Esterase EstD [subsurface metagenome]